MSKLFSIKSTYNLTTLNPLEAYPARQELADNQVNWGVTVEGYSPPVFTHQNVIDNEGIWADGTLERRTILEREGLPGGVRFDQNGMPLCPKGRTGIAGRGLLGKYGANMCGGMLVLNQDVTEMVAVQRPSGIWGMPGGFINAGESTKDASKRETMEETAIDLSDYDVKRILPGVGALFIPTDLTTDNAWVEWDPHMLVVDKDELPEPTPDGREIQVAEWIPVDQADELLMPSHKYFLDIALRNL